MTSMPTSTPLIASQIDTVAGILTLIVDPSLVGDRGETAYGSVIASGFSSVEDTAERLAPEQIGRLTKQSAPHPDLAKIVRAYNDGDLDALDAVSVSQPGGPFMQQAWGALRGVKPGETDSYTGLATRAGRPQAVRAAGAACAKNMVAPFVPCHRIVRSDGSLGGYYYGLPVKQALLTHEAAQLRSV